MNGIGFFALSDCVLLNVHVQFLWEEIMNKNNEKCFCT